MIICIKIFTVLPITIDFFRKLEKIIAAQHNALQITAANLPPLNHSEQEVPHQLSEEERSLSPWRRIYPQLRYRNLFDLVLKCEFKFERFVGDWIVDEYFIDHTDDYLVSFEFCF